MSDAERSAEAEHWRATLAAQGITDAAASESIRRRLEDTLFEALHLVREFRDDGGYSGRVYALVLKMVTEMSADYGPGLGEHPLYRSVDDDRQHGLE